MTDTFTWRAISATAGNGEFKTERADFGDGYSQEVPIGLSNEKQIWNVVVGGNNQELAPAMSFIRAKKGGESFYWTPPLGVQGKYRCNKYSTRHIGGVRYEVTFEFKEA